MTLETISRCCSHVAALLTQGPKQEIKTKLAIAHSCRAHTCGGNIEVVGSITHDARLFSSISVLSSVSLIRFLIEVQHSRFSVTKYGCLAVQLDGKLAYQYALIRHKHIRIFKHIYLRRLVLFNGTEKSLQIFKKCFWKNPG